MVFDFFSDSVDLQEGRLRGWRQLRQEHSFNSLTAWWRDWPLCASPFTFSCSLWLGIGRTNQVWPFIGRVIGLFGWLVGWLDGWLVGCVLVCFVWAFGSSFVIAGRPGVTVAVDCELKANHLSIYRVIASWFWLPVKSFCFDKYTWWSIECESVSSWLRLSVKSFLINDGALNVNQCPCVGRLVGWLVGWLVVCLFVRVWLCFFVCYCQLLWVTRKIVFWSVLMMEHWMWISMCLSVGLLVGGLVGWLIGCVLVCSFVALFLRLLLSAAMGYP